MQQLATALQEEFPHLSLQEVNHRILKASQSPNFKKIQELKRYGGSQSKINKHVMLLLVTFMRLPSDSEQLSK